MKLILVGASKQGFSFARRFRHLNETAEIIVLDNQELKLENINELQSRYQLDIRLHHEVKKINKNEKTIVVKNDREEFEMDYDVLVLSDDVQNISVRSKNKERLYSLQAILESETILEKENFQEVMIIGSSFKSLKIANHYRSKDINVTIIESENHILPFLDPGISTQLENKMRASGVKILTNQTINSIGSESVHLNDKNHVDYDILFNCNIYTFKNSLAKDAGLRISNDYNLLLNKRYQTSNPYIYSLNEAAKFSDFDRGLVSYHRGRNLADILMEVKEARKPEIKNMFLNAFDVEVGYVGLNERQLKTLQRNYECIRLYNKEYNIFVVLLFNPDDGQIYGLQIIGDDRIEAGLVMVHTAIETSMNTTDLGDLNFIDVPVNKLIKDALNIAENIMNEITERTNDVAGQLVLDVRNPLDYERLHIKNSINIPLHYLRCRFNELSYNQEIVVVSDISQHAYSAERILKSAGFNVKTLNGGLQYLENTKKDLLVYEIDKTE